MSLESETATSATTATTNTTKQEKEKVEIGKKRARMTREEDREFREALHDAFGVADAAHQQIEKYRDVVRFYCFATSLRAPRAEYKHAIADHAQALFHLVSELKTMRARLDDIVGVAEDVISKAENGSYDESESDDE